MIGRFTHTLRDAIFYMALRNRMSSTDFKYSVAGLFGRGTVAEKDVRYQAICDKVERLPIYIRSAMIIAALADLDNYAERAILGKLNKLANDGVRFNQATPHPENFASPKQFVDFLLFEEEPRAELYALVIDLIEMYHNGDFEPSLIELSSKVRRSYES